MAARACIEQCTVLNFYQIFFYILCNACIHIQVASKMSPPSPTIFIIIFVTCSLFVINFCRIILGLITFDEDNSGHCQHDGRA